MDQSVNVLLVIDKANIVPQRALDCIQGLEGLNYAYGPHHPIPSLLSICGIFNSYYPDMGEWTVAAGLGLHRPGPRSIHPYQGSNLFIISL